MKLQSCLQFLLKSYQISINTYVYEDIMFIVDSKTLYIHRFVSCTILKEYDIFNSTCILISNSISFFLRLFKPNLLGDADARFDVFTVQKPCDSLLYLTVDWQNLG